jgi:UDP-glucose 4-epimerase
MRCIVTGGAGFIGSHISDRLIQAEHEVLVVDNFSSGKQENINAKADVLDADINDAKSLSTLIKYQPEIIFHLAAQISVRKSVADPIFDAQTNILGTVRLAQMAIDCATKKFIFASTGGAIYGEQNTFPATEDHSISPESPYGLSKYCAENYLNYLHRKENLPYIILRFANIYGPRQDPHGEAGVVAIFSQLMLANETPRINGDGLQTRDFVYVGDVAHAALLALQSDVCQGVFNLGTGTETDIKTLANEIKIQAAYQGEILYGPALPGEQERSVISHHLAQETLGWTPQTSLAQGLVQTLKWFAKH